MKAGTKNLNTPRMAALRESRGRICLLGCSLDTANRGVSALAYSLVKIFRTVDPNCGITLLMGARRGGERLIEMDGGAAPVCVANYRLSPGAPLREHLCFILALALLYRLCPLRILRRRIASANPWLHAVRQSALVGEAFGGDSFSDIYGLSRFLLGTLPTLAVLLVGQQLVLLPQTYGPYRHPIARWLARLIMSRARTVMARDQESRHVAEALLRTRPSSKRGCKVVFCPDVAFVLGKRESAAGELARRLKSAGARLLIGLNVNGLLYRGGYTRKNMFDLKLDYREFVAALVTETLASTQAHILLVPHVYGEPTSVNNDLSACKELYASVRNSSRDRLSIIDEPYDPEELKAAIGLCDFFTGSRMHSCIASLSQGVPTVGIAYSRKFLGVFESVGLGHLVVDARAVTAQEAVDRVLLVLSACQSGSAEVVRAGVPAEIADQIMRTFRETILSPRGPE